MYVCFVLNPDFMFLFSLAQTEARVASESASDANEIFAEVYHSKAVEEG